MRQQREEASRRDDELAAAAAKTAKLETEAARMREDMSAAERARQKTEELLREAEAALRTPAKPARSSDADLARIADLERQLREQMRTSDEMREYARKSDDEQERLRRVCTALESEKRTANVAAAATESGAVGATERRELGSSSTVLGLSSTTERWELLDLYDSIEHSKKLGIAYAGNTVTEVSAGGQADRLGVRPGWRISSINGTAMPSYSGAEQAIHQHLGEVKRRDERIAIAFAVPNTDRSTESQTVVTFEAFVTKGDLNDYQEAREGLTKVADFIGVS